MALADQLAQGVQFAAPQDPFAQYAKMQQLQQGQQQLRTGAMQEQTAGIQLEDLKRDRADMLKFQDDLAKSGKSTDLHAYADMMMRSPKHFETGVKLKQELLKQDQFAKIMGGETPAPEAPTAPTSATPAVPVAPGALGSGTFDVNAPVAPVNALAPTTAAPAASVNALAPTAPVAPVSNPLGGNVDALRRKRDALLSMGTAQSIAAAKALDADIAIASREPVYHNVPNVGLVDPRTGKVIVESKESTQPEIKQYEYAKAQGYKGSLFDFKREMAQAGRAPLQPVAPTVTTIQDPTNPNQMISINARDYRGGGIGAPGVIGLTGKTPAATAKQDVIDKGQAQLSSVLDDLRASYDTLDKSAAIPSTQRGTLSNLAASAQASGIGQALGRMGGTEEQSARDTINSSRMMLLNSIKQATGMSTQQLNSNVELTSWLKAVSDPTQSIETVNKILGNIEKFVASGGKYSAKKEGKITPSAASAGVDTSNPLLN